MSDGVVDPTERWEGTPFPELYGDEPATPLCAALAREGDGEVELVAVHHLHDTGLAFVRALAGTYDVRRVIGIPYSAVPGVVDRLRERFEVTVPEDTAGIPAAVREAVFADDAPVVVEEIGGYCTNLARELDGADHVRGVVEDTNQGHWRWEATDLDGLSVRSIADCRLKRVEDAVVGKSIVDGLARYLAESDGPALADSHVHVLGYGNIGQPTARYATREAARVTVYDTDPTKRLLASADHAVTDTPEGPDVVVGVTGNPEGSVGPADLDWLADGTVLVSGSSRRVEFDLDGFADAASAVTRGDDTWTYEVGGKAIRVANRGEPVNLAYSRLPARTLDLVYGALTYCITQVAGGESPAGLTSLTEREQRAIAERYLDVYDSPNTS